MPAPVWSRDRRLAELLKNTPGQECTCNHLFAHFFNEVERAIVANLTDKFGQGRREGGFSKDFRFDSFGHTVSPGFILIFNGHKLLFACDHFIQICRCIFHRFHPGFRLSAVWPKSHPWERNRLRPELPSS
ncbi:conserved hypothetical protein [Brucella ovis ATCC 25840]|nr:conserved hypothetical protein [Brucella ovis ATCC 25840]